MGINLAPDEREYLTLQRILLRQAARKAAEAGRTWRERNVEWTAWADRSNLNDPVQRNKAKAVNLALADAMAAWKYWQAECRRISAVIQGELAAHMLLGQADPAGDPTGLLYDRADDDELPARPAPGPRPTGWAVTGRGPHPTVPVDVPAVRL